MDELQKQRIRHLRAQGLGYKKIAEDTGISWNTVKAYCQRNSLPTQPVAHEYEHCGNCGTPLTHTPGSRKRKFCSYGCRMAWWKQHPDQLRQKAIYHFICSGCGGEFSAYGNAGRKYCAHNCYIAHRFEKTVAA